MQNIENRGSRKGGGRYYYVGEESEWKSSKKIIQCSECVWWMECVKSEWVRSVRRKRSMEGEGEWWKRRWAESVARVGSVWSVCVCVTHCVFVCVLVCVGEWVECGTGMCSLLKYPMVYKPDHNHEIQWLCSLPVLWKSTRLERVWAQPIQIRTEYSKTKNGKIQVIDVLLYIQSVYASSLPLPPHYHTQTHTHIPYTHTDTYHIHTQRERERHTQRETHTIYTHRHTHTHTHTIIYTHKHTYTHIPLYTHTNTHTRTYHKHTHREREAHTHAHTIYTQRERERHTHTIIYTHRERYIPYTHTYAHTYHYTHTHTRT